MASFTRCDVDNSGEIDYSELFGSVPEKKAQAKEFNDDRAISVGHGLTLSDVDAKLLTVKFVADKDGFAIYCRVLIPRLLECAL
ncbi:hypothetical protein PR002_g16982 [Phytophthora rubi]|uniref:Uncharacterized protein n=1 Tax=Phytophthora rubi TaxID=129364 RepID=A0A6A3KDS4_9STRA|nr:hypothetical protein PR002_g16982 [Phytophthora rubi]